MDFRIRDQLPERNYPRVAFEIFIVPRVMVPAMHTHIVSVRFASRAYGGTERERERTVAYTPVIAVIPRVYASASGTGALIEPDSTSPGLTCTQLLNNAPVSQPLCTHYAPMRVVRETRVALRPHRLFRYLSAIHE